MTLKLLLELQCVKSQLKDTWSKRRIISLFTEQLAPVSVPGVQRSTITLRLPHYTAQPVDQIEVLAGVVSNASLTEMSLSPLEVTVLECQNDTSW